MNWEENHKVIVDMLSYDVSNEKEKQRFFSQWKLCWAPEKKFLQTKLISTSKMLAGAWID